MADLPDLDGSWKLLDLKYCKFYQKRSTIIEYSKIYKESIMWIHHIGEIAIGFFIGLLALHFGVHFIFKLQRRKNKKKTIKQLEKDWIQWLKKYLD